MTLRNETAAAAIHPTGVTCGEFDQTCQHICSATGSIVNIQFVPIPTHVKSVQLPWRQEGAQ